MPVRNAAFRLLIQRLQNGTFIATMLSHNDKDNYSNSSASSSSSSSSSSDSFSFARRSPSDGGGTAGDPTGALCYVVAVVLLYGCSIILMIGSQIRKNHNDKGLSKYMKDVDRVHRLERRREKAKARLAIVGGLKRLRRPQFLQHLPPCPSPETTVGRAHPLAAADTTSAASNVAAETSTSTTDVGGRWMRPGGPRRVDPRSLNASRSVGGDPESNDEEKFLPGWPYRYDEGDEEELTNLLEESAAALASGHNVQDGHSCRRTSKAFDRSSREHQATCSVICEVTDVDRKSTDIYVDRKSTIIDVGRKLIVACADRKSNAFVAGRRLSSTLGSDFRSTTALNSTSASTTPDADARQLGRRHRRSYSFTSSSPTSFCQQPPSGPTSLNQTACAEPMIEVSGDAAVVKIRVELTDDDDGQHTVCFDG